MQARCWAADVDFCSAGVGRQVIAHETDNGSTDGFRVFCANGAEGRYRAGKQEEHDSAREPDTALPVLCWMDIVHRRTRVCHVYHDAKNMPFITGTPER